MNCFACHPKTPDLSRESPGSWCEPRTLCAIHKDTAILPTGEPLRAFLDRAEPDTWLPEGEIFSFVINPVTIANLRGWLCFKFGGYAVYEEVFPSSNFFEWATMHWAPDVLYETQSAPNQPGTASARKLAWGGWAYQGKVDRWLRDRNITFPRSVEEAYEITNSIPLPYLEQNQPKADCDEEIESTYQTLVSKRFGHLRKIQ